MSAVTVAPNGLINYRFGSDPNDIFDEAKQLAGDLNGEHPFVLSTEQEGRRASMCPHLSHLSLIMR